jgi:O-antigen/teichoic acid export membrane protein
LAAERPSLARGGLVLAPSVGLAHGLHYAYNVVMAAVLGPAAFGALGALLALILLGSVPGIALQAMAARHTALLAAGRRDQRALWAALLRLSAWWGAALAAVTVAASAALAAWLHLDSPAPMLALALALAPSTFSFASQGMLQGREAFVAFTAVGLVNAVGKLVAGLGLVAAGFGVSGAVAGAAVGTWLGAATGVLLVRRAVAASAPAGGVPGGGAAATQARGEAPAAGALGREATAAVTGLLGLFLLTNLDVPLARHYLPAAASGHYALGAVVAKIAFWGPQFVTTLVFARLVTGGDRRRLLAGSAALIVASGALLAAGLAALAALGVALPLLGRDYAAIGPALPLFAALGCALALVQLLLYEEIAASARRMGRVLALAALAQAALISVAFHDSVGEIVGTALAVALALVAAGVVLAGRRRDAVSARPRVGPGAPSPPAT